ncbi:MAG: 2-nitropropane dioxygenase [Nitriliruptorales bacterium]|nr:2-nitropropane dioxygenase [Nitriliruptorales bacterium]
MWPDMRFLDLFGIDLPIVQAPMAGSSGAELAIAVSEAGGLGSLPCAMLGPEQVRAELGIVRQRTSRPVNLNFFCHAEPTPDPEREAGWRKRLTPYYEEFGIDPVTIPTGAGRLPVDEAACAVVEDMRPEVVSFHFGLPPASLLDRVKASGAKVISSATTVEEARWLAARGCDAVIAQGYEAGGHRGMFLTQEMGRQVGTFPLVPQVVDAVDVPVIAAGGIADGRGIAAAFALGAAAVQIGTAYLRSPESLAGLAHRRALTSARDDSTVLTNVFTGRPARGFVNRFVREVGPISRAAPEFPLATAAVAPIRGAADADSGEFLPLWSGQAAALAPDLPAGELTRKLAAEATERLDRLSKTGEAKA